jgi:hypothetical protein
MVDKVRIKKAQQPRIEQWCKVLEITESRFVEDAITFYLRNLEGKQTTVPVFLEIPTQIPNDTAHDSIEDIEDPEDYDGGIDL